MYWIISLLGIALAVAPFVLGYSNETAAMWASLVIGVVVALTAGYKALAKDEARWEDWLAILAGIAAIVVPFIFFNTVTAAVWTSVVLGALVVLLAGYRAFFSTS